MIEEYSRGKSKYQRSSGKRKYGDLEIKTEDTRNKV